MVKVDVPVLIGVPLRTPVTAFKANQDGRLPALTTNVYVPEPPVALNVAPKAVLAVAFARVAGLTVRLLAAFTVRV